MSTSPVSSSLRKLSSSTSLFRLKSSRKVALLALFLFLTILGLTIMRRSSSTSSSSASSSASSSSLASSSLFPKTSLSELEALRERETMPKFRARDYPDFDYKEFDVKKAKRVEQALEYQAGKVENILKEMHRREEERENLVNELEVKKMSLDEARTKSVSDSRFVAMGSALHWQDGGLWINDEFTQEERVRAKSTLGANGGPAVMSMSDERLALRVMEKEAFNVLASDKMSLRRSVPDARHSSCREIMYDDVDVLPRASVVIIFTNEAWSALLRTVWSVLDTTEPQLLHEIILVDDASDRVELRHRLERYIRSRFPSKVKLTRLSKRSGLIRARLEGAALAEGDALVFLDSHCECGPDWLRPLLQALKSRPKVFAVPIIDVIDDRTLEYCHASSDDLNAVFQVGSFTWNGHFTWMDVPEANRPDTPSEPVATPTMAGGLFAVLRDDFYSMGAYDEQMGIWGGENLEMSFRVWQCGGEIVTIPCSRIGHIFRSFHPYVFPNNTDSHGINTARTAEVWMDEYKRLFYMNRPDLKEVDVGDVSQRLRFRREQKCKSFDWYLNNVFPQKFVPDSRKHVVAYGRLVSEASNVCFDTLQRDSKDDYIVGAYPCHESLAATQFFSFSRQGELRREDNCAQINFDDYADPATVEMIACRDTEEQQWTHDGHQGTLVHLRTGLCLEAALEGKAGEMELRPVKCRKGSRKQRWNFDHYYP